MQRQFDDEAEDVSRQEELDRQTATKLEEHDMMVDNNLEVACRLQGRLDKELQAERTAAEQLD